MPDRTSVSHTKEFCRSRDATAISHNYEGMCRGLLSFVTYTPGNKNREAHSEEDEIDFCSE